jgi:hypothetical protein
LEEGQYDVDISSLPKDLLYKDINWHYMSKLRM